MATRPEDPERRGASLELPKEEILRRAKPLPPPEEMVIEDLTDEEAAEFWAAISE
jgi:hypothetical protein